MMASVDHSLFGIFHILAAALSVVAAIIAAVCAARFVAAGSRQPISGAAGSESMCAYVDPPERRLVRVLTVAGLVLAALEIFKQIYLHFSAGGGAYDWWYFPFQLCSVPMYLCLLLPFTKPSGSGIRAGLHSKLRSTILTFMGGYTFVGAAAALIYPEDILSAAPVMTAHGFVWHSILLFISLLIFMTGAADTSAAGLARAALLFAALSVIAVLINVLTEPVMQAGSAAHSYAAMFYLNPYHISPQPVVCDIQKAAGIPAGLLLYSFVTVIAGSVTALAGSVASLHDTSKRAFTSGK